MSFITTKLYKILLSSFREVALTRKTGLTDWLTDWLTDGSKTLYPPQLVAWGIINTNLGKLTEVSCKTYNHKYQKHNYSEFEEYSMNNTTCNEKPHICLSQKNYVCGGRIFCRKCSKSTAFINSVSWNCVKYIPFI